MLHRALTSTLLFLILTGVAPEARSSAAVQADGIPVVGQVLGPDGEVGRHDGDEGAHSRPAG